MKKIILLLTLLILSNSGFSQNIKRVEPANWWAGMKNPEVQVMLYGTQLAGYQVAVSYDGVSLLKTNTTDNPNYLFLDLGISSEAKPGTLYLKLHKENAPELVIPFELKEREANSAGREGYNSSDVIYLINPDRFANGDSSNDSTENTTEKPNRKYEYGRHGGDIKGIADHLDYIRDMGFTAIWNTPLEENNMKEQSYHGYAITDYYKIDPRYGSNSDYFALSQKAKAMGIKMIKDVVLNHCGSGHWWMADLPAIDWINNDNKFISTNHRRETHQDIHASQYDKKLMTDGWFVASMPDLNQRNPFLAKYLTQNAIWWIESASLAGLRVDTYPYSDPAFSTNWCKAILEEYPRLNIVGEEWSFNTAIISYWQKGKNNQNGYESHLPTVMDFPLQEAIIKGLTGDPKNFQEGMAKVYQVIANDFQYANTENIMLLADNHDMSRMYTQLKQNPAHYKMALVLLATLRGIPQIYYGTEVLLANPNSDSHGEIRADMPGGWPGDKKNAFTGEGLNKYQKEAQDFCKWLFNLRKNHTALHTGKLIHFAPENGVYSYFRLTDTEKIMVIINHSEKPVNLNLQKYRELLYGEQQATNTYTGKTLELKENLQIPAKDFMILKIGG